MKTPITLAVVSLIHFNSLALAETPKESSNTEVLLVSEVKWEPLNPARGDKSPQAGTLWGDRKKEVPTGFLAKFIDGFSSPPHIHNITYRAVVISGIIYNGDEKAPKMWMSPGSFWTQPKGQIHITAAKGKHNMALVEVDLGPYLVQHTHEAFDDGEKPINIDASNVVWVPLTGDKSSANDPHIAYLWGNLEKGQSNGTFLKLPASFKGMIESKGESFHGVVIEGKPQYLGATPKVMEPGSYFGSQGDATHPVASDAKDETILYIRTNGPYTVTSQ